MIKTVAKKRTQVQRVVINLGDDQFCIDKDREVYLNGHGMVQTQEYLYYNKDGVRKKVNFRRLFDFLYVDKMSPKKAIRRALTMEDWDHMSKSDKRKRVINANRSRRTTVMRSDRRRFRSMKLAADDLGCTYQAIQQAIKDKGYVQGFKFRKI